MAQNQMEITLSDDVTKVFQKLTDDLLAAAEALSEERIRAIVREELDTWEKRIVQQTRYGMGFPANAELKSPPAPRIDYRLIGKDQR